MNSTVDDRALVGPLQTPQGAWRIGADEAAAGHLIAAPLSAGSNPNSNMAGRRREDDYNIISFDAEYSDQGAPDEKAVLTRKLRRAVSSPATGVRRLTPVECERLMGWPDGWTEPGSDSRRYQACGDGAVANVAEWIGLGIALADSEAGT